MGIIWTIIIGFVVGVLAKFIHPGRDNMGFHHHRRCSASSVPSWPLSRPGHRLVPGRTGGGSDRLDPWRDPAAVDLRPGEGTDRLTSAELSRPLGLRVFNRTGGALRRIGLPLVDLSAAALFDRARRLTGLSDFGDPFFREPMRVLLDAFETEAELTMLGRVIARTDIVRLLENRLRMADVLNHHPEIAAGEIRQPIFIVGLPRTGTTILHELLAQDPANRVPMTWEVMHPWPPPERDTYETDPRIAHRREALRRRRSPHPRLQAHASDGRAAAAGVRGAHRRTTSPA